MIKRNQLSYYETQSANIKLRQSEEKWDASYYESQSMKLNLTQNRQSDLWRLQENSDKRKTTMTCYSCDKLSYIAQNCCSKNKMSWQQLNILQWVQIITPSQSTLIRINEEIESLRQKLEDTKAQKETSEEWDSDESFTVNTEESQKKSDSDNLVFKDEENFETTQIISIEKLSEKRLKLTLDRTEIWVLNIDKVNSLFRANYYYNLRNLQHRVLCHIYCVDRICKDHYLNNESHCHMIQCKQHWNECKDDICSWHLWDKHDVQLFSEHSTEWNKLVWQSKLLFWDSYEMKNWHYCYHNDCTAHKSDKQKHEFLKKEWKDISLEETDSGKELSSCVRESDKN